MHSDRGRAGAVLLGACLLGVLHSLCFAPTSLWPLGLATLAALGWLWRGCTPRRAALIGLSFGTGLFSMGTYWLYTAVHGFGQAPVALALLLLTGLVALMAGYYALLGAVLAALAQCGRARYWLCALPGGWLLIEWLRGWVLTGFPWLTLGYAFVATPLAGFAPLAGVYAVSLAAVLSAGAVGLAAQSGARGRALAALVLLVLWGTGAALRTVSWTHASGAPVSVAIVQGAVPQDEKWQADNREHTLALYRSLTTQALGNRIVVWPEATLPMLYEEAVPYLEGIYAQARARHSDLVLGLLRLGPDDQEVRNGLVALGDSEQWYYKRHLVPFGEYFPVPSVIRAWMRLKNLAYVDLAPGARRQPPLAAGGELLAATICYEDAYGAEQLASLDRATLLVNVSNDAWYGDSSAPHQHLEITRMRALEAGRWLIRATNDGVSALVDPQGRVVTRSAQFVPAILTGNVVPHAGLTPYARIADWPALLLGLAGLLQALVCAGPRRP